MFVVSEFILIFAADSPVQWGKWVYLMVKRTFTDVCLL